MRKLLREFNILQGSSVRVDEGRRPLHLLQPAATSGQSIDSDFCRRNPRRNVGQRRESQQLNRVLLQPRLCSLAARDARNLRRVDELVVVDEVDAFLHQRAQNFLVIY